MKKILFVIYEPNTNSWCSSSAHSKFSTNFENVVTFAKFVNAEKVVKDMKKQPMWKFDVDGVEHFEHLNAVTSARLNILRKANTPGKISKFEPKVICCDLIAQI